MSATLQALRFTALAALGPALSAAPAPANGQPAPPLAFESAPDDSMVELPRYVVTGERILPPPESWRHATLPGYEILSNASDRATGEFLRTFQQLQASISIILPALIHKKAGVPTLVILCARRDSFKAFIPEQQDPDIFITPTSLFVEDKER
ncbi:MAG: hypothetical protein FWF96_07000, partial [Kiritimatiellaeota bacterium]|nr:hypothetical protein [Kiritimatiellota bacterium]